MGKAEDFLNEPISIIVPVYNVEPYLNRCVASLVHQTYSNLEIILVDDGSTDHSGEICDDWGKKDSRIQVFHKANGGLSDARNYGMQFATGNYLAFVDSDDWAEPDMYEVLYRLITTYHGDISMCAANSVDGEGKTITTHGLPPAVAWNQDVTVYRGQDILKAHLSKNNLINAGVWNKLYRREIVEGIQFPKGKLYEDVFTSYQFLARAQVLVKTKRHEYNYFQRENSICRQDLTLQNFDSIDANAARYNYIVDHAPELEPLARERMLVNTLNLAFRIAKEKKMKQFSSQIKRLQNDVKRYRLDDCGLNGKQQFGLKAFQLNGPLFAFLVHVLY